LQISRPALHKNGYPFNASILRILLNITLIAEKGAG
jgi:hypothetical protein